MSEEATNLPDDDEEQLTEAEKQTWRELLDKPHDDLTDAEITSKIKLSIKRRFDSPEWVLMFEYTAPNGRRADCIAVNTFPSRNFKIVGFEFKASRSDWLNELDDGGKADHFVTICDEWYVVAGDTGIVKEEELPDGWGLLELKPNSEQLWKLQESDPTTHQTGEPERRFWVKFVEKTVGSESNFTTQDIREARKRGYEEAVDEGIERQSDREIKRMKRKAENWDAIKDAGLDFLYSASQEEISQLKKAARLVQMIESDSYTTLIGDLNYLQDDVERRFEEIRESLTEFEEGIEELSETIDEDGSIPQGDDD